jgi:hypothetical protein
MKNNVMPYVYSFTGTSYSASDIQDALDYISNLTTNVNIKNS